MARALDRIDAAMRRIELAASSPGGATDVAAEERYRALWQQAGATLAELDKLIGSLER